MFGKIKEGFSKKINAIFNSKKELNEIIEEIEETLILSDIGAELAIRVCDELRKKVKGFSEYNEKNIKEVLKQELINIIDNAKIIEKNGIFEDKKVILVVGVNGVGKTTSIAKIANMYKKKGKKVLLCAADTYRAGAVEQLEIWAKSIDVECYSGKEKEEPSSVVFDAIKIFRTSNHDILIIDTAGRLQNKKNLMEELEKIKKTVDRNIENKELDVLMVLDASTGQNAISQVKSFYEATSINEIMLAKMDSTSKGGVVFSIIDELKIPIKYIGTGERVSDIEIFDSRKFVDEII